MERVDREVIVLPRFKTSLIGIYKNKYLVVFKLLNHKLVFIRIVHSKRSPDYFISLRTTEY